MHGYNILKKKFGDKINLLYIKNIKDTCNKIEKFEDGKVIKISCDYKDYNSELDYAVNKNKLYKQLKNYRLNLPFGYLLRKRIIKFLINFIPNKSVRHKLRNKYHLK